MPSFARFSGALLLAVGLASGHAPSASAAPTPFGSDLAATPASGFAAGGLAAQRAGGSGALPSGYVAPADGVITGWRVRSASQPGAPNTVYRFNVVRGDTNIFKGSNTDIGTTDGISATFPVLISVRQGDTIGLSNESGVDGRSILGSTPGATGVAIWVPFLAAGETRAPALPIPSDFSVLVQADLETGTCGGSRPTIVGTDAANVLIGTAGNDVILANGGDDVVRGLGGDDVICGGDGNDKLQGGAGKDTLYGEAGRDKLRGGGGKDSCFGGADKDAIGCEKAKQN